MIELIGIGIALALSLFSLARAWRPPQTRKVIELTGRVEDLEFAYEQTSQRMTKRARTEGADTARAAHKEKTATTQALLDHARAVVETAQRSGAAPGTEVVPFDKAALRARYLS